MSEWKDGRRDYGDGWTGHTYKEMGRHLLHLSGPGQACFVCTTPETGEADCDALHAFLTRDKGQSEYDHPTDPQTTHDAGKALDGVLGRKEER